MVRRRPTFKRKGGFVKTTLSGISRVSRDSESFLLKTKSKLKVTNFFKQKKGQVFDLILKFFVVIVGLFILAGIFPALDPILKSSLGIGLPTFVELIIQSYVFWIVFFLFLLLYIPTRLSNE